MPTGNLWQPWPRRHVFQSANATSPLSAGQVRRPAVAFLSALALRRDTLSVAAIQASVQSPDDADPVRARTANLESVLALLDKVQSYGGHKDICLFPVLPLPGDALAALLQAARRYECTLIYGTEALMTDGRVLRLITTIPPNGDVRVDHGTPGEASALVLRTRNGIYRAIACPADAWYPGDVSLTTAIHSPDGRAIVATRSRGEQAIVAVLHVSDASAAPWPA